MGYGRSYDIGVFGSIFGHAVTQNLPVLAVQNLNPNSQTDDVFNLSVGPTAPVFPGGSVGRLAASACRHFRAVASEQNAIGPA